jgi:hypothetical protein
MSARNAGCRIQFQPDLAEQLPQQKRGLRRLPLQKLLDPRHPFLEPDKRGNVRRWAARLFPPPREIRQGTLHGYHTLGAPRARHGSEAQAKQLLGRRKKVERCEDSNDLAVTDI